MGRKIACQAILSILKAVILKYSVVHIHIVIGRTFGFATNSLSQNNSTYSKFLTACCISPYGASASLPKSNHPNLDTCFSILSFLITHPSSSSLSSDISIWSLKLGKLEMHRIFPSSLIPTIQDYLPVSEYPKFLDRHILCFFNLRPPQTHFTLGNTALSSKLISIATAPRLVSLNSLIRINNSAPSASWILNYIFYHLISVYVPICLMGS